jgi:hypothetical protein
MQMQPQIRVCLEDLSVEDNIKIGHNINNVLVYGPVLTVSIQSLTVSCVLGSSYSEVCVIAKPLSPHLKLNFM